MEYAARSVKMIQYMGCLPLVEDLSAVSEIAICWKRESIVKRVQLHVPEHGVESAWTKFVILLDQVPHDIRLPKVPGFTSHASRHKE
jgi:hypothetical protein